MKLWAIAYQRRNGAYEPITFTVHRTRKGAWAAYLGPAPSVASMAHTARHRRKGELKAVRLIAEIDQ